MNTDIKKMYMDINSGSVGTIDEIDYVDEYGNLVTFTEIEGVILSVYTKDGNVIMEEEDEFFDNFAEVVEDDNGDWIEF